MIKCNNKIKKNTPPTTPPSNPTNNAPRSLSEAL